MLRNQELEERVAALEAQQRQSPPVPMIEFQQATAMPDLWHSQASNLLAISSMSIAALSFKFTEPYHKSRPRLFTARTDCHLGSIDVPPP